MHASIAESRPRYAPEPKHGMINVRPAGASEYLERDALIGACLGHASITRDGEAVFEESGHDFDAWLTAEDAERMALAEPRRDWRVHIVSQLEERHYRRESEGRWVLYKRGYGLS